MTQAILLYILFVGGVALMLLTTVGAIFAAGWAFRRDGIAQRTAEEKLSSVRKNTPPSSSSLSTNQPIGVPLRIFWERAVGVPSGLKSRARFWLLTRKPGAMALARMPLPAKWVASH